MNKTIAIIDYGMGNLRSVQKALESLGHHAVITDDIAIITNSHKIILPGVGAFGAFIRNIQEKRLIDPLLQQIKSGKPFLGICLGLQILFEKGYENGEHDGLGLYKGSVIQFNGLPAELKVPHMGWNSININKPSPLLKGIQPGDMFYFVHSYHVSTNEQDIVLTRTNYGYDFVSAIAQDNLYGVQFHPEKSGHLGLKILDNFAHIN